MVERQTAKMCIQSSREKGWWKMPIDTGRRLFLYKLVWQWQPEIKSRQVSFKMRNLAFREPLQIHTAHPLPQLSSQPHYLQPWDVCHWALPWVKRGDLMIDVKCHVQCGLPTITNPWGHKQVDEGISAKERKLYRKWQLIWARQWRIWGQQQQLWWMTHVQW